MEYMTFFFWHFILISVFYYENGVCVEIQNEGIFDAERMKGNTILCHKSAKKMLFKLHTNGKTKVKIEQKRSGEFARLVCHINSKKSRAIEKTHWFYSSIRDTESHQIYRGEGQRVRIVSERYQDETALEFKYVQPNDAGFYIYRETKHQGQEICVLKLDVFIQATANCESKVNINEFETAILSCSGRGNPVPTLSWYRMNIDRTERENITITGNKLILRNVSRYAAGYYECHAANEIGTNHCEIYLNVMFFPDVDVYEEEILLDDKHDVTLICRVTSSTSSEIIWNKGNNTDRIRSNPRYTIVEDKELKKTHMTTYSLLTLNSQHLGDTMFDVYWCSTPGFSDKYKQKVIVKDVSMNKNGNKPP